MGAVLVVVWEEVVVSMVVFSFFPALPPWSDPSPSPSLCLFSLPSLLSPVSLVAGGGTCAGVGAGTSGAVQVGWGGAGTGNGDKGDRAWGGGTGTGTTLDTVGARQMTEGSLSALLVGLKVLLSPTPRTTLLNFL